MRDWLIFLALVFGLLVCCFLSTGCTVAPVPVVHTPSTGPGTTPAALAHTAVSLEAIIILGVIALGVGIGLYFTVPETHKLSITLAGCGGSLAGVSLLLKVSLWLIPWIAYSLIGLGILALTYEIYIKASGNPKKLPDLTSISGTGL